MHVELDFSEELTFCDFIDYIWQNPDKIFDDEHTSPRVSFCYIENMMIILP